MKKEKEKNNKYNPIKRILFSIACISLIPSGFAEANASGKNAQLIQAAYDGNLPAVQTLLTNNANVNAINQYGVTALMMAAFKGHTDVAKILLENGANVNTKIKRPLIPLLFVGEKHKAGAIYDSAVRMSEGDTALIIASNEGHKEVVQLLIEKGADIKVTDGTGVTALIRAAAKGWMDATKILMENGADVNAKDNSGDTALICTARTNHTEIIKLLLENGANINEKNFKGETPLISAARECETDTVIILLEKGADINAMDKNGLTTLHAAMKAPNIYGKRRKNTIELLEKYSVKE